MFQWLNRMAFWSNVMRQHLIIRKMTIEMSFRLMHQTLSFSVALSLPYKWCIICANLSTFLIDVLMYELRTLEWTEEMKSDSYEVNEGWENPNKIIVRNIFSLFLLEIVANVVNQNLFSKHEVLIGKKNCWFEVLTNRNN